MTAVQWVFLLAGSLVLSWISRRSLTHPACHGFYRFFAPEATLTLLALNAPYCSWTGFMALTVRGEERE
ncbi:MAG: hypothetical protein ACOCP9_02500 [Halofilum sp. (in: g-proteobacteria)]